VTVRDYTEEHQDLDDRKYAYDFDYRMHGWMLQEFAPYLGRGRVLELGCYRGEFTARLVEAFEHVTVVEAAADLVTAARSRAGDGPRFLNARFEDVDLDETFDAVFLTHTLEHLDNPRAILQRIQGWLGSEGRLFLVVPNANAASRQIAVNMGLIAHNQAVTQGEQTHGHRKTYSLDTLQDEVRGAGLRVERAGGIGFKPLANFQIDRALRAGIIDDAYLEACFALGRRYPDLCASIYTICRA
jgi:2-polyprenyl-3-methyl-5-hydroxy-6-metoxy-1,4-benzoquinol methylase